MLEIERPGVCLDLLNKFLGRTSAGSGRRWWHMLRDVGPGPGLCRGSLGSRHQENSWNEYDGARENSEKVEKHDKHVQHRNKASADAPHIFRKGDWRAETKLIATYEEKGNNLLDSIYRKYFEALGHKAVSYLYSYETVIDTFYFIYIFCIVKSM